MFVRSHMEPKLLSDADLQAAERMLTGFGYVCDNARTSVAIKVFSHIDAQAKEVERVGTSLRLCQEVVEGEHPIPYEQLMGELAHKIACQRDTADGKIAALESANARLREVVEKLAGLAIRGHYGCEDSWYSCPMHPDGCADGWLEKKCNCGADEHNAKVTAALSRVEKEKPNEV